MTTKSANFINPHKTVNEVPNKSVQDDLAQLTNAAKKET